MNKEILIRALQHYRAVQVWTVENRVASNDIKNFAQQTMDEIDAALAELGVTP